MFIEIIKNIKTLSGHNSSVYCLAVLPDGLSLASGSGDFTIRIWNIKSGETTQILE